MLMVMSLSFDLFAIEVHRTRRNGDGSGNYGVVKRTEIAYADGEVYRINITCENPGHQICPMSIMVGGMGVDNNQHEAALLPYLNDMYALALAKCQTEGSYSGSGFQQIMDTEGNLGMYVYSLVMTYNSATQEWNEKWIINKL